MNNKPIGIFDSGVGGLSVRAEIARRLPEESLLYFGDGKNCPYGHRSKEEITTFASEAIEFLISKGVKMVVVACNAATGAAINHLRTTYDIPIIGMEPAVKPAALTSKSGVIGVIATAAAFKGELYKATATKYREKVEMIEVVGEGFVELIESNMEESPEAYEIVENVLGPILEAGADRIVLGCTHYSFLQKQIVRVIGSRNVKIVDSTTAIVNRIELLLSEYGHASQGHTPVYEFHTAADEAYRQYLINKSCKIP